MTDADFQPDTLVMFGRPKGEKTLGKVIRRLPSGKYEVEQLEARSKYRVGTVWTVPAHHMALTHRTTPKEAPKARVAQSDAEFAAAALQVRLPADCKGEYFARRGVLYQIENINLRRPTYPVGVSRVCDGKRFKVSALSVRLAINALDQ